MSALLRRLVANAAAGYPPAFMVALGVALCFFISMHALTAPIPLYVTHLGGDALAVGLASGLFALCALVMRAPVGWLADRVHRWWLIAAGCVVYAVSSTGYLFADTVPVLLALRTFHGIGIATFTTGFTALAADLAPPERRGAAIGVAGTTGPFTLLFAPALGDWLRLQVGFSAAFILSAAMALLGLLLLTRLPRNSGHSPQRLRRATPMDRVDHPGLGGVQMPLVLAMALCGVAYGTLTGFFPTFAVERGVATSGPYFTAFAVALVAARVSMGAASDRWGRRTVMLPGLGLLALSLWAVAAMSSWWWMIAGGLMGGAGMGAGRAAIEAAAVDGAPPARRGWAINAIWVGFDLGISIGSMACGPLADGLGYGPMFGLVGSVCLVAVAIFTLVYRG